MDCVTSSLSGDWLIFLRDRERGVSKRIGRLSSFANVLFCEQNNKTGIGETLGYGTVVGVGVSYSYVLVVGVRIIFRMRQ